MAISEIWTIQGPVSGTLSAVGIDEARLSLRHLAPDTLDLALSVGTAAGQVAWTHGAAVTLRRSGATLFTGKVAAETWSGTGQSEGRRIRIDGPLADLDRLVYTQAWKTWDGGVKTAPDHPRVTLGASQDGRVTRLRAAIQEVLSYAARKGVNLRVGELPAERYVPLIALSNRSCLDCLRQLARWLPDWVCWVDYSTAAPTLRWTQHGAMPVSTLAMPGDVETYSLTRRHDQVPTNVVLAWEATVDDPEAMKPGGDPDQRLRLHIVTDSAGGDHVGVGTVVAALPVSLPTPGQPRVHAQPVLTRPLPRPGATDEAARLWWLDHSPLRRLGLKPQDIRLASTSVGEVKRHDLVIIDEETDPVTGQPRKEMATPSPTGLPLDDRDRPPYWTDNLGRLPRELVSGQIQDWMRRKTMPVRATATIGILPAAIAALPAAARKELSEAGLTQMKFGNATYYAWHRSAQVRATDAITKTYKQVVPADGGKSPPLDQQIVDGVAAAYYEATKRPVLEGSATLVQEEAGSLRWMGRAVRFTGGLSDWASPAAPVVSETLEIGTGTTTLTLGGAAHLSIQDFAEALRAARTPDERTVSTLAATRDPQALRRPADPTPVIGAAWTPERKDEDATPRPRPRMGFEVYLDGSAAGRCAVWPSFVAGVGGVARVPTMGGTSLLADPAPSMEVPANGWLALKLSVIPEVDSRQELQGEETVDVHFIQPSGGDLVGNIEVEMYSSADEMDGESRPATVNPSSGAANAGVYVIPLARMTAGLPQQLGYRGPIAVSMCSNGWLAVTGAPAAVYAPEDLSGI